MQGGHSTTVLQTVVVLDHIQDGNGISIVMGLRGLAKETNGKAIELAHIQPDPLGP